MIGTCAGRIERQASSRNGYWLRPVAFGVTRQPAGTAIAWSRYVGGG
jgi:hypothetical protein